MKKALLFAALLAAAPAHASDSDWTIKDCVATTGAALSDGRVSMRAGPRGLVVHIQTRSWRFGSVPLSFFIGFDDQTIEDGIPGMAKDDIARVEFDSDETRVIKTWLERFAQSRRVWVRWTLKDEVPWWSAIRGNKEAAEAMLKCLN